MSANAKSGYETIYKWVASRLADFDLAANAPRLGLGVRADGSVVVNLLGRDFVVSRGGVEAMDGRPADVNRRSLAGHYAMSPGRGEPSWEFVKLDFLSGQPAGAAGGSFSRAGLSSPLVKRFGRDLPALEAAAASLGGEPCQDQAWIFRPLPKTPLKLVFQAPDEEFEADCAVLYDRRSKDFLDFEALAFLGAAFSDELLRRA
jgi:hypothetical protein